MVLLQRCYLKTRVGKTHVGTIATDECCSRDVRTPRATQGFGNVGSTGKQTSRFQTGALKFATCQL